MMFATIAAIMLAAQPQPQPQPTVRQGLEPLGFLVGHCWRGRFASGEEDTHCFDTVFDGQHVRDSHQVVGGARPYRGETLYSWDGAAGAVIFTYWNSAGGISRGTMRPQPDRLDFGDETYRGPDGRQIAISTWWRRVGDDAYDAVSASAEAPAMNRTVRYQRVTEPVSVSQAKALDGSWTLVHETIVAAPVAEVWTAIATPAGWRGWAVPVAWTPADRPDIIETSYSPAAEPGDPSTIRQQILAAVPGRMLAFRTVKAPHGFPHFDAFSRTTFLFELEPVGEGRTRVRLTGAGFSDDEAGRALIAFFRDGNKISLERLARRFVDGPVDWSRMREQGH